MAVSHRPLALAAAVATAAALGATVLTLPAHAAAGTGGEPAAAAKPPAKFELKDGTLTWGVKESFRKYVTGPISGGKIQVAAGAKQAKGNGPFTFTGGKGTYDVTRHAVSTTFKGSVRFLGHKDMKGRWELDLKFTDLKVVTKGKTGRITADVTAGGKTRNDVAVASLDLSKVKPGRGAGGAMTFPKIPAKLTADGAKAFAYHGRSFYKAGDKLDPATLSVKQGKAIPAPKPPAKPTPTPKPKPKSAAVEAPKAATEESLLPLGHRPKPDNPDRQDHAVNSVQQSGTPTAAASGTVYDGNLYWGVKKKFRDYVTGPISDGKTEIGDGAQTVNSGFRFVKGTGTYDAVASSLDAKFNGSVHFLGHKDLKGHWELDIKFSDFKVKANGTKGTLNATVNQGGKVTADVPLVNLKLNSDSLKPKDGVVALNDVLTTLTSEGSKVFSYHGRAFYKPGEAMDPLTAHIAVDKNAKLPADDEGSSTPTTPDNSGSTGTSSSSTPSESTTGTAKGGVTGTDDTLARTGADTPTGPLAGSAAALVVAGGAAVWGARRKSFTAQR
ncbi:HtaA domain-containing protein [Streptomyces sp. AV19]|uniref:HtaA domain-containing protein n=1 Tax=Streptomyces sp. AV19 TaxID=2793068 RepID=UPI0018FE6D47|nr:HtaA domain-containing protein [Streptomyces sp. AV19]MBH1933441.1 HtaA domain-containing protein [Streptomyces sp. AV19]MDG4532090.1 HtaA domain-containing protein [Streptomyces sp. AV19]